MKFARRSLHKTVRQTITRNQHIVRSTHNNHASLISDIRSVIEVAGVCEGVQCECVDIWECGKAWDTLKSIEAILDNYEKTLKIQVSCETCNKKDEANAVANRDKDAWDVIG
jgi:hypothetical protein